MTSIRFHILHKYPNCNTQSRKREKKLIILIRKLRISGMENTRSKPVACPTDIGLTTRKFGKNKNPVDY
jgi:hypothetical protein